MKVCFFLQRRFVYLGHAIACHLSAQYPGGEFCALVQVRSGFEFLKNQKDIAYTSLILEEDIHKKLFEEELDEAYLKWLEKEYGIPNLWPYLYVDRVVMHGQLVREYPHDYPSLSEKNMLKRLQVTAKAIIALLETEKPDAVVTSVIGSVGSMLLYHIAKKKGIHTIHIEFARIGNRIALSEDYRTFTWVKKRFEEIQAGSPSPFKEQAKQFLEEFRANPAPYDAETAAEFYDTTALKNLHFLHPKNLAHSIPWHIKTFLNDLKRIRKTDYTDIFIWWAIWDKFKRKIRALIGYRKLYFNPSQHTGRFAYYPLHIEPEVATLLYAPYYTNQLELIRAIARSLPIDMLLYVKEHPGMVGYRTRAYYREIVKIPNVRLIPPEIPGNELAKNAALTVTITSTSGWESLLLKKPVITFGDIYYNDIPGVLACRNFEELPYMVKKQLEKWRHNEETLVNYVSALLEDSVAVDLSALWNTAASLKTIRNDEGMKRLSALLGEKLAQYPEGESVDSWLAHKPY